MSYCIRYNRAARADLHRLYAFLLERDRKPQPWRAQPSVIASGY